MKSLYALTYSGPKIEETDVVVSNALTLVFGLLGIVSVLVIVYAGIRLSLARGNPDAIGKLRGTIIYASIGLIVSVSATAIISFITGRFQ